MEADLHTHTTASDGTYTPEELVKAAYFYGLRAVAVTDHDTIDGIEEAIETGKQFGIEVIPGIELSANWRNKEVHILGYFLDWKQTLLKEFLSGLAKERYQRAQKIVNKLLELNIKLDFQEVKKIAGSGVIGRPHIAQALIKRGYAYSIEEVFKKYIGRHSPAYVPRQKLEPAAAIKLLQRAKAIPVLAHPGLVGEDPLISSLVQAGLKGIEVYYPEHHAADRKRYLTICARYDLISTGGSDFHGFHSQGIQLGSSGVSYHTVQRLKKLKEEYYA